ncbi:DnaJ family domain-containing protein [Imhoffiella purpurea]|uniref:DnaJ homologue subfamily C member 28 conserved domain-containing protein n=1 Tax=Imhoffiella purpurea TaxID=1249627 RepID=W9V989_9GAMM|nr:DnaJ family domain-containing protein [Imhoffiella purpurea]EXJ16009.1 hypothetical protein D779_0633 [Imhoffiella purpurea]
MDLIDKLAEQHIQRAIDRGELSNLPGEGKPIPHEDLSMVPEHLRAGYRLLKGAGYLPPELEALRELKDVEALLARAEDPGERGRHLKRLRLLETRLSEGRGHGLGAVVQRQYMDRLAETFGEGREPDPE